MSERDIEIINRYTSGKYAELVKKCAEAYGGVDRVENDRFVFSNGMRLNTRPKSLIERWAETGQIYFSSIYRKYSQSFPSFYLSSQVHRKRCHLKQLLQRFPFDLQPRFTESAADSSVRYHPLSRNTFQGRFENFPSSRGYRFWPYSLYPPNIASS
jgi:hypothetical protein